MNRILRAPHRAPNVVAAGTQAHPARYIGTTKLSADFRPDARPGFWAIRAGPMLMNLPNLLTLSRIAAIPVLVALVVWHTPMGDLLACALFTLAGITDWLDGRIARQRQMLSDLGRMLDPIADKLLVGATLMVLAGTQRLSWLGLYPAIVIMCREILVSGLREYLASLSVGLPVTRLAKWKTGLQMVALGLLLAGDDGARLVGLGWVHVTALGGASLFLAAALTLITGWDYLVAGLRHVAPGRAPVIRGQGVSR